MYGSPPAKDLNRTFPPPYGHPHHHHHQQPKEESELHSRQSEQQQQQQMSSGLLRYRSAPSSLFGEACEDFLSVRPSSPETDTLFARFLSPDPRDKAAPAPPPGGGGGERQRNPEFPPPPPQMLYQHHQQQLTSMGMDADQIKNGLNLIRQSSSPAGLFSHLNVENGYGVMTGGMGGFRNGNEGGGGGGGRLKSQLSFSSRQSSSAAAMMSQISEEIENESMEGTNYPIASWEESSSSLLSDNYFPTAGAGGDGLRRTQENQSEIQNGEARNGLITHQFSLPKSPSEMAALEKFLQFQDSVPCKIRAKRGCATHPRSIAERVRRTRISERMRKLQELVPNMDKQTNTADMLDLAVDYIKELQKQAKTLSNSRVNCTCSSSKQKPHPNPTA